MGFVATEAVEELTYDFNPFADAKGTIPEPSSKQIEAYRNAIVSAFRSTGIDPEDVRGGKFSLDKMDELMEKTAGVEEAMVVATADLTGIATGTLRDLPYRPKAAFMGWVMGQFFNPEA